MAIQITSFLNKVLTEAPRTSNMWEVDINTGVTEVDKILGDNNFTFYLRDFKLPEIALEYKELYFRSIPIPVPTSVKLNQSMTVTLYADVPGKVQQALRGWMTQVIDIDFKAGSYLGGTRSVNESSTMRLKLLDSQMSDVVETVTLVGVTIEKIGELQFTQENAEICKFQLTFRYCWPSYDFGD